MSKLLNTTFLVTMSSAAPEDAVSGNVYASGSKIYFTSSQGNFDLTDAKGYIVVREYVTNSTWSPPANAKYVRLLAVAGGGGGGGGGKRLSSLSANTAGGGGGAGGILNQIMYLGSAFTQPTYTVTVGGGGNSGSGNTNAAGGTGTAGTAGGITSLTSGSIVMIRSQGGSGGGGGGIATGQGGVYNAGTSFPTTLPYMRYALEGGNSNISFNIGQNVYPANPATYDNGYRTLTSTVAGDNRTCYHALNGITGMGSGGGGGPQISQVAYDGASGSGVFVNNTASNASAGGLAGTGNAGVNGTSDVLDIINLFYFSGSSTVTSSYGVGSAGGGGGSGNLSGTISGGNGGDGGNIGAGAGGGGACNTGSLSGGKGGRGGDGYLVIIEYY